MRMSLRWTLILYLAGLQLLAVAAILSSSYVSSERTLLEHARALMRDVAVNTIEHSSGFLAPAEAAAELSKRLAENEIVARDNPELLEKLLFEQIKLAPQFAGLYYGDEAGDFIYVMRAVAGAPGPFRSKYVSRAGGAVSTTLIWRDADFNVMAVRDDPADRYDPRSRPWYVRAKAEQGTVWTDPYIFYSSKNPGVTVASPLMTEDDALSGVVGVDIEIGAISSFLGRLKIGENGAALIMNRNGDVIAHRRPEIIKTEKGDGSGELRFAGIDEIADPIARSAFAGLLRDGALRLDGAAMISTQGSDVQYVSGSFDHAGGDYVSTLAPMPNERHPWIIGVYAPKDDFIGAIRDNRNRNILIALALAAATALIGAWLAHLIHRPVRALAERATRISRGRDARPAPLPASFVELERAGLAFNRMSIWLARKEARNAELTENLRAASQALEGRVAERTAELAALNARLHQEIAERGATEKSLQDEVAQHSATMARLKAAIEDATSASTAKSQFLSSMSHELRSPLNAIIGFTELLQERSDILSADAKREYLDHVRSSGAHMLALVNDVLDLEQVEAGQTFLAMEAFAPEDAVRSALNEQATDAARKGVRIQIETPPAPLPEIYADVKRLRQVLVNLLSNAIKYTDAGGLVRIWGEHRGAWLRLHVADTGRGIKPELQHRVFTPFDRLGAEASDIEGSGVGLALSKQLTEAMGGTIGLQSEVGAGSVFWVDLPVRLSKEEFAQREHRASRTADGFSSTQRLLCVDDNATNLRMVADFLNARDDFELIAATCAEEAIASAGQGRFDLMLVDINLPDMSGFDLLAALRKAQPEAIVLAVSADAMPRQIERGLDAGFDGYITKPVSLFSLENEIISRLKAAG